MTGKEKCEMLKSIRKSIAQMNGFEYYPEECSHVGECPGFCPKCDQESEQLMRALKKKEAAGFPIRINTESIIEFESLANMPLDNIDNNDTDDGETILMGKSALLMPEEDILMDDTSDSFDDIEQYSDYEDSEPLSGIMPAPRNPLLEAKHDYLEKKGIVNYNQRWAIMEMCKGCTRYETIEGTSNGIHCACLSEHFFLRMLEANHCKLKKTSDNDASEVEKWKSAKKITKIR